MPVRKLWQEFGLAYSNIILNPGHVSKVHKTKVLSLQALPAEEADPCPVRTFCFYTDQTQNMWSSEQLFVGYCGRLEKCCRSSRGNAILKQRLDHWIVNAKLCPPGVRSHSTRSVTSSWAPLVSTSLTDNYRAAELTLCLANSSPRVWWAQLLWHFPYTLPSVFPETMLQFMALMGTSWLRSVTYIPRRRKWRFGVPIATTAGSPVDSWVFGFFSD